MPNTSVPAPTSILAIQIVQAAVRHNVTVGELVSVCQNDPAFVMRLLGHVNSASFGLSRRVTSVQHAVSLLGVRGVRNLAVTTCLCDMTPKAADGDMLLGLCLRRGVTARLLASVLPNGNTDDAFTLGLLLEVGLLVRAREDLAAAASIGRTPAAMRPMFERTESHPDHARRGARLAKAWQLGDELVQAIAHHHERLAPESPIAVLGWLTERLAGVFEGGDAAASRTAALEAGAQVRLSAETIDDVLAKIPAAVQEMATELQRDIGPQPSLDMLLRDATAHLVEINRNYTDVVNRLESLVREKESLSEALRAASQKLTSLALVDELTGLANPRAFEAALTRDVARADRAGTPLSLVVVDPDYLRRVNDTHGREVGDDVLRVLGEVLRGSVRASDVAARVSEEAFALILPATNALGALVVAERLQSTLCDCPVNGSYGPFHFTTSIGLATIAGPGCRGREALLLGAAKRALQVAKRSGRNRIEVGSM